jgi:hypothetical protein
MAPAAGRPGLRLFSLLGFGALAMCAGWAAVVLSSATWAQTRQLDPIFPFYTWRTPPFTFAAYENLRRGVAVGGAILAAGWATMLLSKRNRTELQAVGKEIQQVAKGLLQGLRAVSNLVYRI